MPQTLPSALRPAAVMALVISLAGCDSLFSNDAAIAAQAKAEANTREIELLRTRLERAEEDLKRHDLYRRIAEMAFLKPGDQGYTTIRSDIGIFTLALEDVSAYANGSKIRLVIGNLMNATVTDFSATIDWGPVNADGSPDDSRSHTRAIKLKEKLAPGKWSNVTITLDDVPPSEFGFVRVYDFAHKGIQLYR